MQIQPYDAAHRDAVVALSLRAWAPVFASLEQALEPAVYRAFYPQGWRASQRAAVGDVCDDADSHLWVALEDEQVAGFTALRLHADDSMGEIHMIAVDPPCQRRGIAAAFTRHALAWFQQQGMSIAMVETGGDPGHAPARATYEAGGFRGLPVARYFRKL